MSLPGERQSIAESRHFGSAAWRSWTRLFLQEVTYYYYKFTYQYFVLYFEMVDKQVIEGISRVLLPPGGPDGGEKTAV